MKKWKGLLYGIIYGLIARGILALEIPFSGGAAILPTDGLMSISFLFFVPLVIGLITAYNYDTVTRAAKIVAISMPFFSILGVILVSVLFRWEGIICCLMALPIFALMSLIGAFIGVNVFRRNRDKITISLMLFIPFLVGPIENYFGLNTRVFKEETSIAINAPNDKIWKNITRVREISKQENTISLFQILGFPRPVKAELDTVAVGGVRNAIFDRGLVFRETVTEVIPLKILAFSIKADPASTPPTALDEHVMVGGKYFNIMNGKYEIETKPDGKIILHLTSQFRLSTNFNFYSGLWSKLIMHDIQTNILQIVKKRSEAK